MTGIAATFALLALLHSAPVEVVAVRAEGPDSGKPVPAALAAVVRVEGEGPFDPEAILRAAAAAAGPEGRLQVDPPDGAGRLLAAATAPGFAPALAWVPADGGPVEVRLFEGGAVSIAVTARTPPAEPDGPDSHAPVAGALVRLVPSAGFAEEGAPAAVRRATTDASGRARIPDAARGPFFDVEVRAPGRAPGRATGLLAGGLEEAVVLEPAARIAGRVLRVPGGAPFEGARVRAGGEEASSAADGSFALDELPAGVFEVEASASGAVALERPVVRAEAGRAVPVPDLRLALLGRVRILIEDPAGQPVPQVPLRLLPADGSPRLPGTPAAALTGSGGVAVVAPVAPGSGHRIVIDPAARFAPRVTSAFASLPGEVVDLGVVRLDAGGVIEGEVAGPDGGPVEGAAIALVEGETDPLRAAADPAAGGPLRRDLSLPADGRFRVDRVPPGSWTILARAPGRLPAAEARIRVETGRSASGIRLVLNPGVALAGRLLDPAGTPVVDALLVALAPPLDREAGRARSGPGGAFRIEGLSPGEARIRVVLPEESFPDPLRPEYPAVVPGEDVVIRLPARAAVEGAVVDPGGGPVRAQVAVLRLEAGPAGGALLETAREVDRVRAAEDGSFATRPLPEGRWRLRAESPDGRVAAADVAIGPEGAPRVSLRLAAGTTVRGVVVTGDAVHDRSQVVLRLLLGGRASSSVPPSAMEEGGAFAIHGVPPGEHDLVVAVPGLAPVTLRGILVPPEGGVVDVGSILLGRGATLRLLVLGEGRGPLPDAPCAVVDGTGLRREEVTNAAGLCVFGGLAAGPHLLELRLPSDVVLRRPLEIPGEGEIEETIDLGLDAPGIVEVRRSGGPVPGATVRVLDAVRGAGAYAASAEVVADEQGRARVPGLPDGTVLVEVTPPGEPPVRLSRVASEGRLSIDLPADGIEGEVRSAEDARPIDGAVVRAWWVDAADGEAALVLRSRGAAAATDGRGRFRFPSLPAGRYLLEAVARGRGAARAEDVRVVRGGGAVLVELLLPVAARVRGLVRDSTGGPVPGAIVEATDPRTGRLRPGGRRAADASGMYDFDGLSPGAVILTARAGGLGASPPEFLNLAAGEERALDLALWPGGTLEVSVVGTGGVPLPDAAVEVRDFFGTPVPPPAASGGVASPLVGEGRTGPDGVLRVPGLRAGVYVVRALLGDREGEVRVRVDARYGARTVVAIP